MAKSVFARIFRIRDEDDWEDFNTEWKEFILEDLMKRNPNDYKYSPPAHDDWPEDMDDDGDD